MLLADNLRFQNLPQEKLKLDHGVPPMICTCCLTVTATSREHCLYGSMDFQGIPVSSQLRGTAASGSQRRQSLCGQAL